MFGIEFFGDDLIRVVLVFFLEALNELVLEEMDAVFISFLISDKSSRWIFTDVQMGYVEIPVFENSFAKFLTIVRDDDPQPVRFDSFLIDLAIILAFSKNSTNMNIFQDIKVSITIARKHLIFWQMLIF